MLTQGQIQEAMGRAGLVYELLEVERRAAVLEDQQAFTLNVSEESRADLNQLQARAYEITKLLWGEGAVAGEKSWQEEVRELDREYALLAVEHLLRRRPEVTPPEDLDQEELVEIHNWLVAKIGELPEEERTGWTR